MNQQELLTRIELNPKILTGKAVIKGTRLSVQFIIGLLANGYSYNDILNEYPGLTIEDIQACLSFANNALEDSAFYPTSTQN